MALSPCPCPCPCQVALSAARGPPCCPVLPALLVGLATLGRVLCCRAPSASLPAPRVLSCGRRHNPSSCSAAPGPAPKSPHALPSDLLQEAPGFTSSGRTPSRPLEGPELCAHPVRAALAQAAAGVPWGCARPRPVRGGDPVQDEPLPGTGGSPISGRRGQGKPAGHPPLERAAPFHSGGRALGVLSSEGTAQALRLTNQDPLTALPSSSSHTVPPLTSRQPSVHLIPQHWQYFNSLFGLSPTDNRTYPSPLTTPGRPFAAFLSSWKPHEHLLYTPQCVGATAHTCRLSSHR